MSDYRNQLMQSIEAAMLQVSDPEEREIVTRKILCALNDYEIMKRCTDLTIYDDLNDRLIKRYCACLSVDGKSQKTIYAYARQIRRFAEYTGLRLTDVGVYDIRYYLACEKERGISDRSVENTRSYLSAFYQWLTAEEIIPKNPCMNLKPVKYTDKERKAFSAVEIDALRHACKTAKERALIEMLISTGVRVSELTGMDVSDINMADLSVHVRHGKGRKERITYTTEVAKLHLQKYLLARRDTSSALFCSNSGTRISADSVRIALKKIGSRAGVDNVHPHRFRRTFATGLAARGMAVQEIQRLLGHTNINTTMRYICMDDTKVRASYQQYIA